MKPNTLICTVGTSLFTNLSRLSNETPEKPTNWQEIRQAYNTRNLKALARELRMLDPTARLCGAEINTVEEITKKKDWLQLEKIVFLVSDTPDGKNIGKVLQLYFEQRSDMGFRTVEYCVVDDLQDERPEDFKIHGLRNLVRRIGEYIQRSGGPEFVVIDATGGYKAQIAIAVLVGQALNIPIFYRHEKFSEIIEFPPLPVSLDYKLLAYHSDILTDFERGEVLSSDEVGQLDEKLRVLFVEVTVDNKRLYELSPIGEIYLTGFRIRNPKPIQLVNSSSRKPPTFRDDNYPKGFQDFAKKVYRENQWIITANSLPYDKQKAIKGIGFSVKDIDGQCQVPIFLDSYLQ